MSSADNGESSPMFTIRYVVYITKSFCIVYSDGILVDTKVYLWAGVYGHFTDTAHEQLRSDAFPVAISSPKETVQSNLWITTVPMWFNLNVI